VTRRFVRYADVGTESLKDAAPASAADLELLALTTQAPFCWPGVPPELLHALVRAVAARSDELAAGLLDAFGKLAAEPLAGLARAGPGAWHPCAVRAGRRQA